MTPCDARPWRRARPWAAATALLLAACGGGGDAVAPDRTPLSAAAGQATACANRDNNTFDKLLDCVTLDGVRRHQAALQAIADDHDGNRFAGSAGYDASVAYVAQVLQGAGYAVTLQPFQLLTFFENTRSVL